MKVEIEIPDGLHPETIQTVLTTATDLATKLYKAQVKYGLDNGWKHPPTGELRKGRFFLTELELQAAFIEHVNRNDPLDVIAYCAFARELGFNMPMVEAALSTVDVEHLKLEQCLFDPNTETPYIKGGIVFERVRSEVWIPDGAYARATGRLDTDVITSVVKDVVSEIDHMRDADLDQVTLLNTFGIILIKTLFIEASHQTVSSIDDLSFFEETKVLSFKSDDVLRQIQLPLAEEESLMDISIDNGELTLVKVGRPVITCWKAGYVIYMVVECSDERIHIFSAKAAKLASVKSGVNVDE